MALQGKGVPPPALLRRLRLLPLLALVAAALLYTAVWHLPALFNARQSEGTLLRVELRQGNDWVPLRDGAEVAPRGHLRFWVNLQQPASVVLVGLNALGQSTLYAPGPGSLTRLPAGTSLLAEQTLDGVEGPELFLAELCHTPLSPSVVRKAAERAMATVEEPNQVPTLDLGCPEARLLLRKQPPR
jgi:hypothetical protein